tara:strand:- start:231 stop:932 length:702 start_codon:yes stop_codon:yes gene_type:complete
MVHLLEGDQPFGIHGIHGRTLPIAFGIKTGRPELNTIIVAGDGDFLSIGAEHIGPAAQRNIDVTCVIMDNGVYGLTKGQSSPTTNYGQETSSTPFGKIEQPIHPLRTYMTMGVSYIASHYSSKPRVLAKFIEDAMDHKGFSIVHVQSPCTTYNDTYDIMKGDRRKGIPGTAWAVPEDHDPTSTEIAWDLLDRPGIPLGLIYKQEIPTLEDLQNQIRQNNSDKTINELIENLSV